MLMHELGKLLSLPEATARLVAGQTIIFPTDTVWGVGARWHSEKGVKALYQVTKHEAGKPMAILVSELDQLQELNLDFGRLTPEMHRAMVKLMKEFWPGGLTIVLPWSHKPDHFLWDSPDVGVRIPDHPVAQAVINQAGPLLQSSANVLGGMAPASYEAIDPEFMLSTGGVIAGEAGGQVASTVVNLTGSELKIERAGCVPVAEIERVLR